VFPPEDLLKTVKELRSDPTLGDTYKPSFDRSVKQAESILRDEKRYVLAFFCTNGARFYAIPNISLATIIQTIFS
jgi:hypothetical protein